MNKKQLITVFIAAFVGLNCAAYAVVTPLIEQVIKIDLQTANPQQNIRVYWDGKVEYSNATDIQNHTSAPAAPGTAANASKTTDLSKEELAELHAIVKSEAFMVLPECSVHGRAYSISMDYSTPSARLSMLKCCDEGKECSPILENLKQKLLSAVATK